MILLMGKNPMGNVLHVIQGPESAFWNELHGSAAIDITPVLHQMDEAQPVYLHISHCDSEQETAMRLSAMINAGATYPFSPPTAVFAPKTAMDTPQAPGAKPGVPTQAKPKPDVINACTRCLNENVKLVPGLKPYICYDCVKIDLHIAATKKDTD
jgi:hypothetical protein